MNISIFMCSRISGNQTSSLRSCLESIAQQSTYPEKIELLIKFDDDDMGVSAGIRILEEFKDKIKYKYIITPRARGYTDLHKGYSDLLLLADSNSALYWILSDDTTICIENWDKEVYEKAKIFEDGLFVIHLSELQNTEKLTLAQVLQQPESYPIWSKKWIMACGGFGPFSFTDAWTACLEYILINNYGMDRRILFNQPVVYRDFIPEKENAGSVKYDIKRKSIHDSMLTETSEHLMKAAALNIYNLAAKDSKTLNTQTSHMKMNKDIIHLRQKLVPINKKLLTSLARIQQLSQIKINK